MTTEFDVDTFENLLKLKGYKALKNFDKTLLKHLEYEMCWDECNELYTIDLWLRKYKHDSHYIFTYCIGDRVYNLIDEYICRIKTQIKIDN